MPFDTRAADARIDELHLGAEDVANLFAASDALRAQFRLRTALSDPAVPPEGRAQVARSLLADRIGARPAEAIAVLGSEASGAAELEQVAERAAVRTLLRSCGALEQVQVELFDLARFIHSDSELQTVLGDPRTELADRRELVAELLAGQVQPATLTLAQRAVGAAQSPVRTLDGYVRLAAQIRGRKVASVQVAAPLTEPQLAAMRTQLERIYRSPLDVLVEINPEVLGGALVEVDDDRIDGTIRNRLNQAQRQVG